VLGCAVGDSLRFGGGCRGKVCLGEGCRTAVPAGEAEEAVHIPLEVEDKVLVNTAGEDRENSAAVVLEAEDNGKDNL